VFYIDYKLYSHTISYLGILGISIFLCFNILNVNSIINNDDHILPFSICYAGRNPFGGYGLYIGRYIIYIIYLHTYYKELYIGVAQCVMFGKHPTEVPPNILYYIRPQIIRHLLNYVF
jgi:hypothetical protein